MNENFAYYADYICGELSYTIVPPLERVMEQDEDNPQKMTVYHESNFFAGNYTIEVLVQSAEWDQVFSIVPFELQVWPCSDIDRLNDPDNTQLSPLTVIYEIPFDFQMQIPLYIPYPVCGRDNSIFEYKLTNVVPEWITLKEETRVLSVVSEEPVSEQGLVDVEIKIYE